MWYAGYNKIRDIFWQNIGLYFLANRTNGSAYATVLRLSSVTYVLWLNGASYSKSYYWQLIGPRPARNLRTPACRNKSTFTSRPKLFELHCMTMDYCVGYSVSIIAYEVSIRQRSWCISRGAGLTRKPHIVITITAFIVLFSKRSNQIYIIWVPPVLPPSQTGVALGDTIVFPVLPPSYPQINIIRIAHSLLVEGVMLIA